MSPLARIKLGGGDPDYLPPEGPLPVSSAPDLAPAPTGVMRFLAHVHSYPPEYNAGGELALHVILRALVERGHEVRVLSALSTKDVRVDGVEVLAMRGLEPHRDHHRWPDVVLTHLAMTSEVLKVARKPLVHVVHNHRQLSHYRMDPADAALVVFNSNWVAKAVAWPGRWTVCRPHVPVDYYRVPRDEQGAATLINLNAGKGGRILNTLARQLPREKFLGVTGSYGEQVVRPRGNLRVLPNTPDIRTVYRRTRVLLMPSVYESWGRVGVEAACSGIPTIVTSTEGTREALGDAAVFVENARDWRLWAKALEQLRDPAEYAWASAMATARAKVLERITAGDLQQLVLDLEGLA